MKEKIGRFMAGRYGNDKLNQFMMAVFLGCAVLNLFVRNAYASTVLNSWECLLGGVGGGGGGGGGGAGRGAGGQNSVGKR